MIRDSKEEDFDTLADFCVKFWETTDFDDEPDWEHMRSMIEFSHQGGTLLVSERDGHPVGFLAVTAGPLLGNPRVKIAVELAWWMEPEYRNGKDSIHLIKKMEEKLRGLNVKYFSMMSMQSSSPHLVNRIYEKLGYEHAETTYLRVL